MSGTLSRGLEPSTLGFKEKYITQSLFSLNIRCQKSTEVYDVLYQLKSQTGMAVFTN